VILYTRSAGVVYFTFGGVALSVTVKALKRAIRQPRPPGLSEGRRKVSYGLDKLFLANHIIYEPFQDAFYTLSQYGVLCCLHIVGLLLFAHPPFLAPVHIDTNSPPGYCSMGWGCHELPSVAGSSYLGASKCWVRLR
jgi:hypothetical protein